jgi:hypothetical protein
MVDEQLAVAMIGLVLKRASGVALGLALEPFTFFIQRAKARLLCPNDNGRNLAD